MMEPLPESLSHASLKLHLHHWPANGQPRAHLLIVHGLGEHGGRYAATAMHFADRGYNVTAYDHEGHGRSEGKRGLVRSWQHLLEAVDTVSQELVRRQDLPLVLWGHSMGGLIVLYRICFGKPPKHLAAALVTGPPLQLSFAPNRLLVALAGPVMKVAPNLTKSNELDIEKISRDPAVVAAYRADEHVHDRVSMLLGGEILKRAETVRRHRGPLPCPVLAMHGSADGISAPAGTEEFASNHPDDVSLRVWPEAFHELHHEPERSEVLNYAADWFDHQLATK